MASTGSFDVFWLLLFVVVIALATLQNSCLSHWVMVQEPPCCWFPIGGVLLKGCQSQVDQPKRLITRLFIRLQASLRSFGKYGGLLKFTCCHCPRRTSSLVHKPMLLLVILSRVFAVFVVSIVSLVNSSTFVGTLLVILSRVFAVFVVSFVSFVNGSTVFVMKKSICISDTNTSMRPTPTSGVRRRPSFGRCKTSPIRGPGVLSASCFNDPTTSTNLWRDSDPSDATHYIPAHPEKDNFSNHSFRVLNNVADFSGVPVVQYSYWSRVDFHIVVIPYYSSLASKVITS